MVFLQKRQIIQLMKLKPMPLQPTSGSSFEMLEAGFILMVGILSAAKARVAAPIPTTERCLYAIRKNQKSLNK
jgi:hypothetical protein